MRILAVDTSSQVAAVAVTEQDRLLGERPLKNKWAPGQTRMTLIGKLPRSVELKPSDIDVFAASIGPGSFTGLRIGVVTVKALAYAAGKSVVGVPTLDGLAANLPLTDKWICPMVDARNRQVYTSLYKWGDSEEPFRIWDFMALGIDELAEKIKALEKDVIFLGDGVNVNRDFLKEQLQSRCFFAPGPQLLQRASSIASLARLRAEKGEAVPPSALEPFYLRKSQAERLHG